MRCGCLVVLGLFYWIWNFDGLGMLVSITQAKFVAFGTFGLCLGWWFNVGDCCTTCDYIVEFLVVLWLYELSYVGLGCDFGFCSCSVYLVLDFEFWVV